MKRILTTHYFDRWFSELKDVKIKARINARLRRLESGHMGDIKGLGDGVSEPRFFFATGFRIYFTERNGDIVILLCGGDKSSQNRDIARAKKMCANLED
ncbi:type II toxin-antitoxin system RelE/ParE family toxin [Paraneptunicella aestuarii]|uniref:type II toxin-antitoxin system RelE/ParE family toxin n=1 Tax=Paraneptunicella aestuarii TaxID=2831148 RepID=UPI001E3D3E9D|nr:type II toxin-antitoxin system RelE/ParE family toxin [Paraneptunicella aestuarii]UAA38687.1 type II toxin-antitoxin system RelE/ParE family toxin [Paraneptunicella aestuarii]